ncbi:hypothetical protein F4823DRAFT_562170 [Ustulina deusta]|nr:hypothetical protein F4823DRAFT_562170 [Ustulina deusta]
MIPISTPSDRAKFHNAGCQPLPQIDYSKPMQDVFIDAVRYTVLDRTFPHGCPILVPVSPRAIVLTGKMVYVNGGRRFFRTAEGRFGMTAVEDVICVDPSLDAEERPARGLGDEGDIQNMTRLLADPMAQMLMGGFQEDLD